MTTKLPIGVAVLALALSACGKPGKIRDAYEAGGGNRGFWVIVANELALDGPKEFVQLARDACKDKKICIVGIWTDPQYAPRTIPASKTQTQHQAFSYGKNEDANTEYIRWDCDRYGAMAGGDCIPKPF